MPYNFETEESAQMVMFAYINQAASDIKKMLVFRKVREKESEKSIYSGR